jgi:hypothetical protein
MLASVDRSAGRKRFATVWGSSGLKGAIMQRQMNKRFVYNFKPIKADDNCHKKLRNFDPAGYCFL